MSDRNARRKRLGDELRRIRALAGASQQSLADHLGTSQVTVSRIETGTRAPTADQAEAWLRLADDQSRARAVALLDDALRTVRSWEEVYGGRVSLQGDADVEVRESARCRFFQTAVPPGLVQTPEVALTVFRRLGSANPEERAHERITRQQVLYEAGRSFEFLMMERVLDCVQAPHARPGQLAHLASVATLDNVSVGIVPDRYEVGVHSFALFTPASGDGVYARAELIDAYHGITDASGVAAYEQVWSELWAAATTGDDAVRLIQAGPVHRLHR